MEEEEDSSSEDEEDEEEKEGATEEKKREMRREFLQAMQLSFLSGQDPGFDYRSVDQNERYDSVETQERDGEDAYFDSEEPLWCIERETSPPASNDEDITHDDDMAEYEEMDAER